MKARAGLAPAYFPALTGLRALAAFLVFLHHFHGQWFNAVGGAGFYGREGYVGVTVFFTLSGYLITKTYFSKMAAGTVSFFEYWFRRFARVVPAYLALLTIRTLFSPHPPESVGQVLSNYTLTQAFFGRFKWTGIAPAWSLTIEECFYLLAPALFVLLKSGRKPSHVRSALVLGAVSALLWWIGNAILLLPPGREFLPDIADVRIYSIFGRFTEFGIGVLAALTFTIQAKRSRLLVALAALGFPLGLWAGVSGLVYLRETIGTFYGVHHAANAVFPFWFISLGTVSLIWAITNGSQIANLILGNRYVEYLGRISYLFYLVQDRYFAEAVFGFLRTYTPLAPEGMFGSYVGLNGLAALFYQSIEKPVHGRLLGRLRAPKKKSTSRA